MSKETEREVLASIIYNDSYMIASDVEWEDQDGDFRNVVLSTADLILTSGFRFASDLNKIARSNLLPEDVTARFNVGYNEGVKDTIATIERYLSED